MVVPVDDAVEFFTLYPALIGFAARRLGGVAGVRDVNTFRGASLEGKAAARDALLDHPQLVDEFLAQRSYRLSSGQCEIVRRWKAFRRGDFVVERSLREFTVFLDAETGTTAYGVLGLLDPIPDLLPMPLPALVRAVLLPFKGRIVCDGLIHTTNLVIGRNMRDGFAEAYRAAKARGVIVSFDGGTEDRALPTSKLSRHRH